MPSTHSQFRESSIFRIFYFNYKKNTYRIELPEHLAEKGSPLNMSHIIKIEGNLIAKALGENTKWDTFVDVGASEGLWTINMAKRFKHVIAIEPYPKVYELLRKNTESLSNVTVLNHALAEKHYTKYKMIEGPSFNIGMTKRLIDVAHLDKQMLEEFKCKTFTVEAKTMDSLELKNVDMIKIDAEGEEKNVLKGTKETIKKFSPLIFVDK
jgi:FkbM family methyltransferase